MNCDYVILRELLLDKKTKAIKNAKSDRSIIRIEKVYAKKFELLNDFEDLFCAHMEEYQKHYAKNYL